MQAMQHPNIAAKLCCTFFFFSVKVVCIPTVNHVPIPCNYANDTLMRCNCEFIKQQG